MRYLDPVVAVPGVAFDSPPMHHVQANSSRGSLENGGTDARAGQSDASYGVAAEMLTHGSGGARVLLCAVHRRPGAPLPPRAARDGVVAARAAVAERQRPLEPKPPP